MSGKEPPKKNEKAALVELKNPENDIVQVAKHSYGMYHEVRGELLVGSYSLVDSETRKQRKMKYFVLDEKDVARMKPEDKKTCLGSLTDFMKKYPNKKIYIRVFSYDGKLSVFSDDVLEIIPLAHKQQGDSAEEAARISDEWSRIIKCDDVIPWDTTEILLNDRKGLITIVPDFEYEGRKSVHLHDPSVSVAHMNRDGDEVVSPYEAIYQVFRECVCGINWNLDHCASHSDCRIRCRNMILKQMQWFLGVKLVYLNFLEANIETLKKHCHLSTNRKTSEDYLLKNEKFDAMVSNKVYKKLTDNYKLCTPFFDLYEGEKLLNYKVWMIRMMLRCGFIQSFFEEGSKQLKEIVLSEIFNYFPKGYENENMELMLREIAFAPLTEGVNEVVSVVENTRIDKLAADRERRNQKLQQKKQGIKPKPPIAEPEVAPPVAPVKIEIKTNKEEKWKDYSNAEGLEVTEDYVKIGTEKYISNFVLCKVDGINFEHNSHYVFSLNQFWERFPPSNPADATKMHSLNSLSAYSKWFKTLVIRSIRTSTGHQVLASEIFEIIPLLMEKQNVPLEDYEKKLKSYREKLGSGNLDVYYSVDVSLFKIILNSFNVDPNLITIIPDTHHYLSMKEVTTRGRYYVSTEIEGLGNRIMSKEQAIFYIFLSVICGANWIACYKRSKKVVDDFSNKYFEEMGKIEKLRKGTFVTEHFAKNVIGGLLNHELFFDGITILESDFDFGDLEHDEMIPRTRYREKSDYFDIPEYSLMNFLEEIPVWLARSHLYLGWIQRFYPSEMLESKKILVEEMVYFVPEDIRETHKNHLMNLLKDSTVLADHEKKEQEMEELMRIVSNPTVVKMLQKTVEKPKPSIKPKAQVESVEPIGPTEPVQIVEPIEPTVRVEHNDLKQLVQQTPKKEEPVVVKPKPKPPSPCKCSENGINLLKTREALKKAEILAKRHEGKAKRAEKVENNLDNMTQKMKELEKEMEELGLELEETDELERKMRVSNKQLVKEIGELEGKLKSEQENTVDAHQRSSVIKQKVEGLQVKLALRESQMEARKKNVKASNDEEPSKLNVQHVPKLGTTDDPELAANPDWHLEQWRKLKEECEKDDVIQEEMAAIERLLAKVEDHEVKTMVEYELIQFEGTLKIYLQNIEMNINKIERTRDFSNLQPISKYPSLSKKFVVEFEKQMGV